MATYMKAVPPGSRCRRQDGRWRAPDAKAARGAKLADRRPASATVGPRGPVRPCNFAPAATNSTNDSTNEALSGGLGWLDAPFCDWFDVIA
jgi:hypothetical protein